MRILLSSVVLALVVLWFLVLAGADEANPVLRLHITRDLRGRLEPCDCKAGVLGGFPRRASVIAERSPDLLLDAGDLIFQASPYDHLKLRLMLELEGKLGYAAVNLGRREAEFSREDLLRTSADSPVPLISSNLVDQEGNPVLPGHVLLELRGHKIVVVGAVTRHANPGSGLRLTDPVKALRGELASLQGDSDLTILLSALDVSEMERVVKQVRGIDLLLGGFVPRGSKRLEVLGNTPCFLVQGKGQYLGEVDLLMEGGTLRPAAGRRIVLGPDTRSEAGMVARIRAFQLSLEELDLLGRREEKSPTIGSAACAACHGETHQDWLGTAHAKALGSLRPDKGLFDPQCLQCHTTAPGRGGYVSEKETPEYAGVGCESCHGPSRAHAEAPLSKERPRTPGKPAETCRICHTPDHSEDFQDAERLQAIRHQREGTK